MEMDLQEAIERSGQLPFSQSENKFMMYQLLSAMNHIHCNFIVHRDVKTSNILVHRSARIAVCDFGLARKYQHPPTHMTQTVITLWYRPPELLLGESVYGPEVDMWSCGCIFGELLKKDAILKGQGELDQIDLIFKLLGVPTDASWPGYKNLPSSNMFRWRKTEEPTIRKTFPTNSFSGGQSFLDPNGYDLLLKLLTLDPRKRITAEEALKHEYFHSGVKMESPAFDFQDTYRRKPE
jgi:cell division cycle 2-like protein